MLFFPLFESRELRGEAADGQAAIQKTGELLPDLLLLDLSLPIIRGFEVSSNR
jgi:CheY-like chemotaxis protein